MNVCNFVGRLTATPNLSKTTNGTSICRFNLAVRRNHKTNGEYITDFLPCVAWRESAEYVGRYCCKGQLVSVTASARNSKITTKSGDSVTVCEFTVTEVQGLSKPQDGDLNAGNAAGQSNNSTSEQGYTDIGKEYTELDEDLPF